MWGGWMAALHNSGSRRIVCENLREKKKKDEEAGGGREWRAWEEAATERSVYAAGKVCVL